MAVIHLDDWAVSGLAYRSGLRIQRDPEFREWKAGESDTPVADAASCVWEWIGLRTLADAIWEQAPFGFAAALGIVFTSAGCVKLAYDKSLPRWLSTYRLGRAGTGAARAVAVAELAFGLLLLVDPRSWLLLGASFVGLLGLAAAMTTAWIRSESTPCGCSGLLRSTAVGPVPVIRNGILAIPAVVFTIWHWTNGQNELAPKAGSLLRPAEWATVLPAMVISLVLIVAMDHVIHTVMPLSRSVRQWRAVRAVARR